MYGHGVAADPSKIEAMVNWPTPTTTQFLRGFLGLTNFYRKFIRDYAAFATLLTSLLQKDNFHWGEDSQLAFDSLKRAMTQAPVLALPDFSHPFTLETDASGTAMGVVLMQGGHPWLSSVKLFVRAYSSLPPMSANYVPSQWWSAKAA